MKKIITITFLLLGLSQAVFAAESTTKKVLRNAAPAAAGCTFYGSTAQECLREIAVDTAVEVAAVPATVALASTSGMTAGTGTAIASLSGAAATSATLASIGSSGAAALGAVGIVAAPAVVGGAIVGAAALGVAWGVNRIIDLF